MPILMKTDVVGAVTWLGLVADRPVKLSSDPVGSVNATYAGLEGEYHSGLTRKSCARVRTQYAVGTEIRNARQISILSAEEVAQTAQKLGLDYLEPTLVGANIILSGIPDLTQLPPSTRIMFPSGASLVVDMENAPCQWPAKEIEAHHPGHGKGYKAAAKGLRGVTAWVECKGTIELGDKASIHIPPQRIWPHG